MTELVLQGLVLYPLQIEWKSLNFHSLSFFVLKRRFLFSFIGKSANCHDDMQFAGIEVHHHSKVQ